MNANHYWKAGRKDNWNSNRYPLTNIGGYKKTWRVIMQLEDTNQTEIIQTYQNTAINTGLLHIFDHS